MQPFCIENQLLHVSHPSDSLDLARSDFWLFGPIKTGLADQGFAEPEELFELFKFFELFEGVRAFLERIHAVELTAVFKGWIRRVRWVIVHNWQYYSNEMLCNQFRFPIVRPWLCRKNTLIPRHFDLIVASTEAVGRLPI
jgi:hypothetical protein